MAQSQLTTNQKHEWVGRFGENIGKNLTSHLDNHMVHRSGTETINGNKTLSGTNTLSGANTFSGTNTFSGYTNVTAVSARCKQLNIAGNVAMASHLAISAATASCKRLTVNGDVTMKSHCVIEGTTASAERFTFRGNVTMSSALAANDDVTVGDGKNLRFGNTTGTKLGTATTNKMALWGRAPVTCPAAVQTAIGATTSTHRAYVQAVVTRLENIGAIMKT
jgi:hypothetical protein